MIPRLVLYRVAGVTDNGDGTTLTVEFQTPIQATVLPGFAAPGQTINVTGGVMVAMEGVVEVMKAP